MLVVVASYRQNVHAYPSGGGDYEVATTNLGQRVGLAVASALMVDYTLTVAVSVSPGVANLASAFPALNSQVTLIAVLVVAVIALLNLRGVRESGTAFAIPTYCFIGVGRADDHLRAHPAGARPPPARARAPATRSRRPASSAASRWSFLLLRAFSSGCTALTGVEAISNGVPAFRKPKSKNAATTLALLGVIAVTMFAGVTALALVAMCTCARPSSATCIGLAHGHAAADRHRARSARAVFGGSSPLFYILQLVTALILVLAANTAFNGFPVLASILAQDGYLPRQLHTRGDRLAFSNGILLLSGFAILLIVAFQASPTRLIQLYIIGVFVSFVCSQTGMIRHWNRLLRTATDRRARLHMIRSRAINTIGAFVTGVVLVIVLVTKFASGRLDRRWSPCRSSCSPCGASTQHYAERRAGADAARRQPDRVTLPASNRAIVLVSKLHLPTLRALAYARATRPSQLEAITVDVDEAETARLQGGVGPQRTCRCRSSWWPRRTGRSPGRSSST